VTPTNLPPASSGISFPGGVYLPSGELSLLPPSGTLAVVLANAPQNFINGGTGSIFVIPTDPSIVLKAIVSFSGIPGYFVAPTTLDNGQVRIDLSIGQNFMADLQRSHITPIVERTRAETIKPSGNRVLTAKKSTNRQAITNLVPTGTLTAMIQLMALDGTVSPGFPLPLIFQAVGSGPIQVSLSWGVPVDLDLHVVTPDGEEIYYANRCDSTGGCLDLDSNAACNIDNIDNENVVWPNTTTPAPGQYIVRMDYWSNCGDADSIPYTVTVSNCGSSSTYTGTAESSDADQGGAGSGTTVTTFTYQSCAGLSVTGSATYEDFVPTLTGLSSASRALPIRYATVEVHQSSDDSLLQTGNTDVTGSYSISFSMTPPGKYYVKVLAQSPSSSPFTQSVMNNQAVVYSAQSAVIDASMQPNATGVTVTSTRAQSYAGAFNIFDVGVNAFNFVRATYGTALPTLTWNWTPGVATCGGKASCFDSSDNSIDVLSSTSDTDEYDDSVLGHEFGHFHAHYLTRPPSASGDHNPSIQVSPLLAWSEGLATFFGQSVLNSPIYIDTNASGAYSLNLETPESDVPTGTSDGTLSGNVSEAIVYATLWDLEDSAQDSTTTNNVTVTDVIANPQSVFSDLTTLKTTTHDRGAAGVDLVDFLDQWLCSGYSTWDTTPGANFNGLVTILNTFPYSPQQPANCN
jgi:hypothetical protein